MFWVKKPIEKDVWAYLDHYNARYSGGKDVMEDLSMFIKMFGVRRIEDIKEYMVKEFYNRVMRITTQYFSYRAVKSLRGFLVFHKYKNIEMYDIISDMRRGPTPNFRMIAQVADLRKQNMSFRQIASTMEKDVKTVYRWHQYLDMRHVGKKKTGVIHSK